jgi:hypothetical protein
MNALAGQPKQSLTSGLGLLRNAGKAQSTLNARYRRTLAGAVIALKFVVPSLMPRLPFFSAWGNYVLDSVDGDVLLELGLSDETYQTIDKAADYYTYIVMVIVGRRWRIPYSQGDRVSVLPELPRTTGVDLHVASLPPQGVGVAGVRVLPAPSRSNLDHHRRVQTLE